mgnify:FL=1
MEYHELKLLLTVPAVRIIRAQNAPLILGFMQRAFKSAQRVSVPEGQLRSALEAYLDECRGEDLLAYPQTAAEYLADWCGDSQGFLRRYYGANSDEPLYELTTGAEKALLWLESLRSARFVGTESRLGSIFAGLDEILKFSDDDADRRIEQLLAEANDIHAKIDRIRATGRAEAFTPVQINERYAHILATARELLADFRQVEDNFKRLAHEIAERHARPGMTKGAIVGHLLDSHDALRKSEQGQSFFAFWELLLSPDRQQRFQEQVAQVAELSALDSENRENQLLQRFISHLLREGEGVVSSHQRLSSNLRRILDTTHFAERRRLGELLQEIRQAALAVRAAPPSEADFFSVEVFSDVFGAMIRPLWQASESAVSRGPIEEETGKLTPEELRRLHTLSELKLRQLRENVEACLAEASAGAVTLTQVLERFPPREGIMAVVGYLIVASDESRHYVADDYEEIVEWGPPDKRQRWQVPRLLFSR